MNISNYCKFVRYVKEHHIGRLNYSWNPQRLSSVECFLAIATDVVKTQLVEFSEEKN